MDQEARGKNPGVLLRKEVVLDGRPMNRYAFPETSNREGKLT
jgi:hypothetical protein